LRRASEILSRDDPPKLWAVLTEGVLRQVVGAAVMRAHLGHLIEVAGGVRIRDTKDRDGFVLNVPADAWRVFVVGVKEDRYVA
jgi:hypothetical protein